MMTLLDANTKNKLIELIGLSIKPKWISQLVRCFIDDVRMYEKYNHMNLFQSILYTIKMFWCMGPDLYVKYNSGTAVESVDFY